MSAKRDILPRRVRGPAAAWLVAGVAEIKKLLGIT